MITANRHWVKRVAVWTLLVGMFGAAVSVAQTPEDEEFEDAPSGDAPPAGDGRPPEAPSRIEVPQRAAPTDPGAMPESMAGHTIQEIEDCLACHDDVGVSGHLPPKAPACFVCHTREGGASGGEHAGLSPATTAVCGQCHDTNTGAREHAPVAGGECFACHDPHGVNRKNHYLKDRRMADLCDDCHNPTAGMRYPHTGTKLGQCTECHAAHGGEHPSLLVTVDENEMCGKCHAAEVKKDKVDHWPAQSGQCTVCHDPHGSDNEHGLALPDKETCYQCHPPKEGLYQVHSAVKLGKCSTCHDPHGSDNDRKLRADPVSGVCFRCHYDDITGREVVHKPIADGNCTMCHDPHTTGFPKNLRAAVNTTCSGCHPDKWRPDVKTPHPAILVYGCTVCHDPHASDNMFRLRKPIIEMCTTCHKGFDDGYHIEQRPAGGGHPIGGEPDPLREGRELTCTSCHDPHGTDNPRMWYEATERMLLCVGCHRRTLAPGSKKGQSSWEQEAQQREERRGKKGQAPAGDAPGQSEPGSGDAAPGDPAPSGSDTPPSGGSPEPTP